MSLFAFDNLKMHDNINCHNLTNIEKISTGHSNMKIRKKYFPK